ncbi:MAG: FmdB family zinc ribbon protein [Fimbriimonadaceae bacterium]
MPIYEYEPDDRECLMCDGRVEVLQSADEDPLTLCPWCGLSVRRVISRPSFKVKSGFSHDKAAERGFTTWKRTEFGKWEKVAGEGVDAIVGSEEDIAAIKAEKESPKVIDLDRES